jgi:hypothetical protein
MKIYAGPSGRKVTSLQKADSLLLVVNAKEMLKKFLQLHSISKAKKHQKINI